MALDGLEQRLPERFGSSRKNAHLQCKNKVYYVRFADYFVVSGTSKELLENEVKWICPYNSRLIDSLI